MVTPTISNYRQFKSDYREREGREFGVVAVEKYVHNDLIETAHQATLAAEQLSNKIRPHSETAGLARHFSEKALKHHTYGDHDEAKKAHAEATVYHNKAGNSHLEAKSTAKIRGEQSNFKAHGAAAKAHYKAHDLHAHLAGSYYADGSTVEKYDEASNRRAISAKALKKSEVAGDLSDALSSNASKRGGSLAQQHARRAFSSEPRAAYHHHSLASIYHENSALEHDTKAMKEDGNHESHWQAARAHNDAAVSHIEAANAHRYL